MGDAVNLTALVEARAKMTPGEYEVTDEPDYMVTSTDGKIVCDAHGSNAVGIVATHNAAPALIEVARAAKLFYESTADCDTGALHDALFSALSKVSL